MEYGLCCLFKEEDIKFKTFTLSSFKNVESEVILNKILEVYFFNINSLQKAFNYCRLNNFKSYRISSDLLPHFSNVKERVEPYMEKIIMELKKLNSYDLKLSFHPGQFNNIGSPNELVVKQTIIDLSYHYFLSEQLNVGEINIHVGGVYGDKEKSIKRFLNNLKLIELFLPKITLENDEYNYSIFDVIKICKESGLRATYDLHHQKCFEISGKQSNQIENIFLAKETWGNYDYQRIHISSPKEGAYVSKGKARSHADYIDLKDFDNDIVNFDFIHADIEAKFKEISIKNLQEKLKK